MNPQAQATNGAVVLHQQQANAVAHWTPQHIDLNEIQALGKMLAASGYFADSKDAAQAGVKVLAGRELGIPPVAAMMGINIIKGKVALGAHLIASRVKAHGYDFRVERLDNNGCKLVFLSQPVNGKRTELGPSEFTEGDAKAAGVLTDMYKKYPRNMYYSRAMSNGAKWFCPDIFGGAPVYTPEELGADVDENGELKQQASEVGRQYNVEPGTQAAADAVAQQKIADAKKQADAKPASDWRKNFQAQLQKAMDALGEESLGDLLQAANYGSLNDLTTREKAAEFWRRFVQPAMTKKEAEAVAAPTSTTYVEPQEQTSVTTPFDDNYEEPMDLGAK